MYFIKGTAINFPFRYDCRNEIERDHAFSVCHGCMYQYNNNEFSSRIKNKYQQLNIPS